MTTRVRCSLAPLAILSVAVTLPTAAGAACPAYVERPYTPPAIVSLPPAETSFFIYPRVGRAPLLIRIGWSFTPVDGAVRFEVDIDGDGRPEWSAAREPQVLTHTLVRPGTYTVAGRVTYQSGHVVRSSLPIRVISAMAFDAEISARWATFKAALARNDLSQALECLITRTREHARQALQPGSRFAAELLRHADTLTFYRNASSVDLEYLTDFVDGRAPTLILSPDVDDVWRIDAYGWPAPQPPGSLPAAPRLPSR